MSAIIKVIKQRTGRVARIRLTKTDTKF